MTVQIAGQKFGRLTAIEPAGRSGRSITWRFQCDCGNEVVKVPAEVSRGKVSSCGCLGRELSGARMKELAPALNKARATHGKTKTPTFNVWVNMIQRCTNPNHKSYARYGGRGITVCRRWMDSFEAFLEDMGERPFESAQIDRERNGEGYNPDNCRWTTTLVNANNRDTNRAITFDGRTQNIKQWAAEKGMSHQTIAYRLKAGWSVEDALTRPVNYPNR